jgi:hypothetical protein
MKTFKFEQIQGILQFLSYFSILSGSLTQTGETGAAERFSP